MSEICGAAMVCGAFLCAHRGVVKNKALPVYLSAVMLGLAVSIRIQLVFFAPALIAMALIDFQGRWGKWLGHCAAALGVFFLAASPMFILNWTQFGNPLATGYHFWVPSATEHGAAFSTRYFLPSIAVLWREFSQSTTAYSVAHIFGSGVHFVPAFALLAAVGLFYVRNRKVAVVAAFGCITYACAALFYFYNDIRMYVPLLILMALPAGLATGRAIESIIRGRNVVMSIVIVILFLGAVIGYPSQAGFLQKSGQIQALYSLGIIPHRDGGKPRAYTAAMEMAKRYRDQPGIVLSFINPVFLNSVLPNGFTAAPVNGVHEYSHSRQWRYGSKDAAALARRGSEESLPVYALLTNNEKLKEEQEQLPSVPGWTWREVPANKEKAVILKLQPLTDLKNPASSRGK